MVNKKSLATFVRTVGNQVIVGFKHFLNNVKISGDLIHDPDPLGSTATNLLTVDPNGVVRKATSLAGATGTVTSVALTAPSAFTVTGSPITTSGTIAIGGAGTAAQYVRGDGQLGDFPTSSGGGSSVSYYLNGSVNQGTLGGNVYREFSKTPIVGAGTDFTIAADGYIAQFITDVNDPSLLEIPGGNWNLEFYFSSSSSGGTPSFYVELSKYDGTTFTPIANNSGSPEFIAFGTIVSPYFTSLAVPQTTLAVTDRLAIRIYVIHSGRTITLHTENSHLCQVITTFSTGLNALNGLTKQVQYFATGTSGTNFNISSVGDTHTFNIPTASGSNRGLLSTSDWTNFTAAYNDKINSAAVTGTTTKTLTLTQQDGGTITASWTDINTDAVTSVFGRTGAIVAVSGDYNTSQVTENTNLYFTNARARTAISLTTTGTSGAATYDNATGVLNIPQYQSVLTNPVTGTGTTNYVTKWTSASAVGNSQIFDNGTSVGIGTASPLSKLHVETSASNPFRMVRTGGSATNFGYEFGSGAIGLYDYTNSTYRYYITSGGNVGIGTTSPAGKLDVRAGAGGKIIFGSYDANYNVTIEGGDQLNFYNGASATTGYINYNGPGNILISRNLYVEGNSSGGTSGSVRITSTGNVGIGTTSPASSLHIYKTSYPVFTLGSGVVTGNVGIDTANNFMSIGTETNHSLSFATNNSAKMRITAAGDVGIGTTAPSDKLDVNGVIRGLMPSDPGAGTTTAKILSFSPAPYGILFRGYDFGTHSIQVQRENNSAALFPLSLQPLGGNVGIGTTTPGAKLDVVGNTYIRSGILYVDTIASYSTTNVSLASATNLIIPSGNVGIGTTSPNLNATGSVLHINTSGNNASAIHFTNATTGTTATDGLIIGRFGDNINYLYTYENEALHFGTNNGVRMVISAAGSVGIGNTSPGAPLDVTGNARATTLSTVSGLGLNVGAYAYLSQTISGVMTFLGHNVRASDSVANTAVVQNASWISSLIKLYYNEGITFHTDTTVYAAGATYPLATTERMRIQTNGNVGIGTSSAFSRFTVSGALTASSSQMSIVNTEGGHAIIRAGIAGISNNGISLVTANVDGSSQNVRMVVSATGNVGIGTTSPTSKLYIEGGSANWNETTPGLSVGTIHLDPGTDTNDFGNAITFGSSDAGGGTNAQAGIYLRSDGNYGTKMYFATTDSYGAGSKTRMFIGHDGNVGIGTTSPSQKLDVVGNISVATPTGSKIGFNTTDAFSAYSTSVAHYGISYGGGANLAAVSGYFGLGFFTLGTEQMRITSGGNVGIGTTSPSAKLHVIGNATVSATLSTANAKISGTLADSFNQVGTAGQVLSSTGTGIEWITGGGGGGGSTIIVKDEGTSIGSSFGTLDFYGENVQATASGSTAIIAIRNNAGTGSQYLNDLVNTYAIPGSYTDTVNINGVDIIVPAPGESKSSETLTAILTFGILNVTGADRFNAFYFRLYNNTTSAEISDTQHRWSSYMSVDDPTTIATFHIPIKLNEISFGDDIYVQCQTSVVDAPEIYYCALTFIKGSN